MAAQASRMSISPQHCFLGILSNHFDSFIDGASRLTRFSDCVKNIGVGGAPPVERSGSPSIALLRLGELRG